MEFHGVDAESRLSPAARKRRKIGWKQWAAEFNDLLTRYEAYVWPDLIILGGGAAKDFPKYEQFVKTKARLVIAALGTTAGIVGAARVGGNAAQDPAGTSRVRHRVRPPPACQARLLRTCTGVLPRIS